MGKFMVALVLTAAAGAASRPAVEAPDAKMASMVMERWPAGVVSTENKPGEWSYEEGVLLDGMAAEWHATGNSNYLSYILAAVDKYVTADGTIRINAAGDAYPAAAHSLDNVELGRAVLLLYRETRQEKYAKAAKFLHEQLAAQPRTASGGYWHKQIYPNQMWLDGAYMAAPFRAEYAATFENKGDWDDVAQQLLLMDAKMRDPRSGLLRHGWDESKAMAWADPKTGLSPEVWSRAMGWYCMALVDVLDWMPETHPQREAVVKTLKRAMVAVVRYQDPATGLWWEVMDRGEGREAPAADRGRGDRVAARNYLEASASCMFVYVLAKGVRKGYLPPNELANARRGWEGIQKKFVKFDEHGTVTLGGTVKVGGLGGSPYRSGTYEYYVGERTIDNDAKGVGTFLMAGSEMRQAGGRRR